MTTAKRLAVLFRLADNRLHVLSILSADPHSTDVFMATAKHSRAGHSVWHRFRVHVWRTDFNAETFAYTLAHGLSSEIMLEVDRPVFVGSGPLTAETWLRMLIELMNAKQKRFTVTAGLVDPRLELAAMAEQLSRPGAYVLGTGALCTS